jgi:hypothetical protein
MPTDACGGDHEPGIGFPDKVFDLTLQDAGLDADPNRLILFLTTTHRRIVMGCNPMVSPAFLARRNFCSPLLP